MKIIKSIAKSRRPSTSAKKGKATPKSPAKPALKLRTPDNATPAKKGKTATPTSPMTEKALKKGKRKADFTCVSPKGEVFTVAEITTLIGHPPVVPGNLSTEDLTAFYNANVIPTRRYTTQTREQAELAVLDLLLELKEKPAPKGEKAPKAAKAKTEKATGTGSRPGRTSSHAGKTIYAKGKENPRRAGTFGHTSFQIILAAGGSIKVEDYFAKGGRSNDLAWDINHNFVEVK